MTCGSQEIDHEPKAKVKATKPAKRSVFICRICDHVEENPTDTWRCKACLHTSTMDLTEIAQ
jgi:rubrerythrin